MGIVRLTSVYPKGDKVVEVRSMMERRTLAEPGTSLSQSILGELPGFLTARLFNSMADFEKAREELNSDSSVIEHRNTLATLVRQSTTLRIMRTIVDPIEPLNLRFSQQVIFQTTAQGTAESRNILEAFAIAEQANGRSRFRMALAVYPHTGPEIMMVDSYASLAESEDVLNERAPRAAQLMQTIGDHLRAPVVHRFRETVVSSAR